MLQMLRITIEQWKFQSISHLVFLPPQNPPSGSRSANNRWARFSLPLELIALITIIILPHEGWNDGLCIRVLHVRCIGRGIRWTNSVWDGWWFGFRPEHQWGVNSTGSPCVDAGRDVVNAAPTVTIVHGNKNTDRPPVNPCQISKFHPSEIHLPPN